MKFATYIFMLIMPCMAMAQTTTVTRGDSLYMANDFEGAIGVYEQLAETSESASLYYNLGNAYYKTGNIAKAILNYERSLLLAPADKDTKFNLALAQSKAVDKIGESYEIFFAVWMRDLVNTLTIGTWATMGIVAFIVLLLSILLFLSTGKIGYRKIVFCAALISLIVTLFAKYAAWNLYERITDRVHAIIMQPTVTAKSTPAETGTNLFVIHEGRKVKISDDSMKGWKEIELEEGNRGWIPAQALEKI